MIFPTAYVKFFAMLNDAQKQAVEHSDGPLRILAGAGTGKTRTVVSRVGHLLRTEQAKSHEILLLTFTNKSAHELNERLHKADLPRVHATTFHGLAAGLLRQFWQKDFTILSAKEQEELLRNILYSQERDDLTNMVSDLNNVRQAAACEAPWPKLIANTTLERLSEIWHAYSRVLTEKKATDFTGLLTTVLELWRDQPAILEKCQTRYRFVHVDEYQDVSPIQIKLVERLTEPHKNLCVVGDPDQTIYSWRGAQADSLAQFLTTYPDATSITLTKNYRNPEPILKGAEALITHNEGREAKPLEATLTGETPITLWENTDEWRANESLFYLLEQFFGSHDHMVSADHLDTARKDGFRTFNDVAILYRTQAEGRLIAAHLAQKGYPYQQSSMLQFWEHRDVQGVLQKFLALREIGKLPEEETFSTWFREQLDEFIWHQSIPDSKQDRLQQLLPIAMAFDHLPLPEALDQFLNEADTAQEADNLVLADKINLLTLHAAKGLEFPIVLIMGLEEGHLPHKKLKDDPYWLAEERRLLYVGMTRAREQLHLFTTRKVDSKAMDPSRFIGEIGPENLTYGKLPEKRVTSSRRKQVKKAQVRMF